MRLDGPDRHTRVLICLRRPAMSFALRSDLRRARVRQRSFDPSDRGGDVEGEARDEH